MLLGLSCKSFCTRRPSPLCQSVPSGFSHGAFLRRPYPSPLLSHVRARFSVAALEPVVPNQSEREHFS